MLTRIKWARWATILLLIGILPQIGCLHCFHSIDEPTSQELGIIHDVGQCQKNKVYLFLISGCDPLDLCNVKGLRDYLQSIGYVKTYYGNCYHTFYFEKELCRLWRECRDHRFVLIGNGHGAGMARDLACSVGAEGIPIDLIVYMNGQKCNGRPLHRPSNVMKALNLIVDSVEEVPDAENHVLEHLSRLDVPTDKRTLCILNQELAEVARRVQLRIEVPPSMVPPSTLPAPKEVLPTPKEWSFLQPDVHSRQPMTGSPTNQALATDPATMPRR